MAKLHVCDRCLRMMPESEVRATGYTVTEGPAHQGHEVLCKEMKEFCVECAVNLTAEVRRIEPHEEGLGEPSKTADTGGELE